jgi:hypothetical protein
MLVESGLSIALDEKICALNNGGCLTPATALVSRHYLLHRQVISFFLNLLFSLG